MKTITDSRNEPNTEPHAMRYVFCRPSSLPNTPQRKAPISGSRMMSHSEPPSVAARGRLQAKFSQKPCGEKQSIASSVLHGLNLFDVDGAAAAEDRDDDGQAHGGLGGSDGDDEERADVAGHVALVTGEREEREVRRVEHQLDGHEDDERVAP